MDLKDFREPKSGRLVPILNGHFAFVPAPLPPDLIDYGDIAFPLAEAMQAIGELNGACRRLQNPYMLIRPLQRNEALISSAMEGTFTTADALILAEAGMTESADESTREVRNYLSALSNSLDLLKTLPISHRVIRRAHQTLLSGLSLARGAQKRPGEYKREQNWIGGYTIEKARFVPPPPDETQRCMDELEAYINRERETLAELMIDLALVHYQIEAIHPFSDGNGRVGRMLVSLMAVHGGLLDMPVLYISPALERVKDEYIDQLYTVSTHGLWGSWLRFFLSAVTKSCRDTIVTIDRIIDLQIRYRQMASEASRSAKASMIVDYLFEHPAITATEAASRLNVSYPAARASLEKLVELRIIREVQGRYPKVYLAPEIMEASRPRPPIT